MSTQTNQPASQSPLSRRNVLTAALAASACAALGRASFADDASATTKPAGLQLGKLKADKVLFAGNSITLHPPAPAIGWTGNWGMAATAQDKDYVHLLLSHFKKAAGAEPASMVRNIADFERGFATFDFATGMKDEIAFEPDIIIVAIGENVPNIATDIDKANFEKALTGFYKAISGGRDTTLFVRSCFWVNPTKDEILKKTCLAAGGTFVDISALGRDESNAARSERKIAHAGVGGHPGDKGMAAIAEAIWSAIETRAGVDSK